MILGLLRHGVAEDAGPQTGWSDATRRLTDQGRARIERAARGIAGLGLDVGAIVTSPLVRCLETAQIVGAALSVPPAVDPRIAPGFDVEAALAIVLEHPGVEAILICGHQPDLSDVTYDLVRGGIVEFKKGGLALVDLAEARAGSGLLTALYPPSALRRMA
jgi:phosphohistidine phosphatase SixA